jgi:hypothetical protein
MPYLFLRLEGLLLCILALISYFSYGGTYLGLFLIVLPDITLLGYLKNPKIGSIIYNLGHTYLTPILSLVIALSLGKLWGLLFTLLWFAHIGIDRALGLGLKFPDGFKNTHLGRLNSDIFSKKKTK